MADSRHSSEGQLRPTSTSGVPAWCGALKTGVEALLLIGILTFAVWHWDRLTGIVDRVAQSPMEVSVSGFIKVMVPAAAAASQKAEVQEWLAVYRAKNAKVRVVRVQFEDKKTGEEFVEIEALQAVDLSAGHIGDGSKLLTLPDDPDLLHLKAGDKLRIYTYRRDGVPARTTGRLKQTLAFCAPNKRFTDCDAGTQRLNDGIFKADVGEGDEVVVFTRDAEVLLDFQYWWPMPATKGS